MKRTALAASAWLISLAFVPAVAMAGSGNDRPLQRVAAEHLALLFARDYEALDKAADEARRRNRRTSDGQPLLAGIYMGTAGSAFDELTNELWQLRKSRLEEWSKRKPASVTARVSLAYFPAQYAWFARGTGFSGTVSRDGWKVFRERTEEARVALLALDADARADAGWYEAMLAVGLSQHWPPERYDALFEEAVRKHPDYLQFDFYRATYYAPRWYGSAAELQRVVEEAVERTRPRMGETLYARLHWSNSNMEMFKNGQTDWTRMKAGFQRMLQDYPDAWNLNNFGRFACQVDDWDTVKQVTDKIGDTPIVLAWLNNLELYQACRRHANRVAKQEALPGR
jgi:hypothetical protein